MNDVVFIGLWIISVFVVGFICGRVFEARGLGLEGIEYRAPGTRQRDRAHNVKDTVLGLLANAGMGGLSVDQVLDVALAKGIVLDRGTVSSLLSRLERENTLDMKDGRYFVSHPASTVWQP